MPIHPTAIIDPNAKVAPDADIGAFCAIGPDVTIGANALIRSHVAIRGCTTIGANCVIHESAVIGGEPQDLKYKGEKTELIIGDHNIIREFCTLNPGTVSGGGKTIIGNYNLLMAYVHIAHDCYIDNHVVLANGVQLGGHIHIEDGARLSAFVAVHHFATIGALSFISGLSTVTRDIPPFTIVQGMPAKVRRLNEEGLRRKEVPEENMQGLKKLFKMLFRKEQNRAQVLEIAEAEGLNKFPECRYLLDFLEQSSAGALGRGLEARRAVVDKKLRDGDFGYKAKFE